MDDIRQIVKQFIVHEIVSSKAADFCDDTPLQTSGILDSLSTLELVSFLEERFDVRFELRELTEEKLASLASIERLVLSKTSVLS